VAEISDRSELARDRSKEGGSLNAASLVDAPRQRHALLCRRMENESEVGDCDSFAARIGPEVRWG
jgi:hypothetical protein